MNKGRIIKKINKVIREQAIHSLESYEMKLAYLVDSLENEKGDK